MRAAGNALRRTTGAVTGEIRWGQGAAWEALPATVRCRVRDLLDEACDLIEYHRREPETLMVVLQEGDSHGDTRTSTDTRQAAGTER